MANPATVELTRGSTKIGVVTDERFRLLDGSRFTSVHHAEVTVRQLAQFVDRPPTAHAA
jgi:hypothetical protein